MDAASGAKRSGLVALVLAAVAVLIAWAFFAGGASGTDATAPLGTAAVLVAAALVVGWSRGRIALPRLDHAGLVGGRRGGRSRRLDGPQHLVVDRRRPLLGRTRERHRPARLRHRRPRRRRALPGRPLRSLALLLAVALGAVLVWALLGKAIPALGPDDAGSVARLKGSIGYWNALALLADAALGSASGSSSRCRERFGRPAGALLLYAATIVDPADAVARGRDRRRSVVVAMALWLSERRVEAALLGLLAGVPAVVVAAWAFTDPRR